MFARRHIRRLMSSLLIVSCANPLPLFAQQPQDRTLTPVAKPNTNAAQTTGPRAQRPELVLQTGVTEPAVVAAFSPDGRWLATMGMMGKAVKLWELKSGRELAVLNVGESATMAGGNSADLAFSADGKTLTTLAGGSVRQWDVATARRTRTTPLFASQFGMELARLSPNGRYAAAWLQDKQLLQVWEVESGRSVSARKADREPSAETNSLAFNADGSLLVECISERDGLNGISSHLVVSETATGRAVQTINTTDNATRKQSEKETRDQMKAQQKAMMDAMRGKGSMPMPTMAGNVKTVDPLRTVRVSPDGRFVALGIYDQARQADLNGTPAPNPVIVKLYEMKGGREAATINLSKPALSADGFAQYVENHIAFSPDGKWLAAISADAVKLCETATGRVTASLSGHRGALTALAFSHDGRALATAGYDNQVVIHDLARPGAPAVAQTFGRAGQPIGSVAFAADGRALVTGGAQSVNLWETRSGMAVRTVTLDATAARNRDEWAEKMGHSSLSADGQFFAAPSGSGAVKVWDVRTGREVRNFALTPKRQLKQLALNQDGSQLLLGETPPPYGSAASADAQAAPSPPMLSPMVLGGLGSGGKLDKKQLEQMHKQAEEMQKLAESGQIGKVMEMMGGMGLGAMMPQRPSSNVRLFDLKQAGEARVLNNKGATLMDFNLQSALSPDGRLAAVAWSGASVKLNDVAASRELASISLERGFNIQQLAFSPDAKLLAVAAMEMRPGVNLNQMQGDDFSQMYTQNLHLYDISNASAPRELRMFTLPGWTSALAFSPNSKTLAVGGEAVKLFDLTTGSETKALNGHALLVNALAFSPDGKLLFSGGEDGGTKLWDAASGALLATLVTINGGGDWLVVTPDGLFDGTPAAWRQILWRFSANVDDVSPVEVYFNEFFTPGLLAEFFAGKRPQAAKDVSLKDRRQPLVALRAGDDQANSSNRNITVKLEISEPAASDATNPVGARDVRLFRNGTLVKVWRGDVLKGQRQTTLEAALPIVAGENRLTAYAFNRDNIKSGDAVLSINGAEALRRKGTAYVLACGVNRYANEQFNLKYAVADATTFGEEIRAQQNKLQRFERTEIVALLDAEVTRANVLLALKRLGGDAASLPANAPAALQKLPAAQPEDAVVIYFAGHGIAHGGHFYLIPHDLGYAGARATLDESGLQSILQRSVSDLDLESAVAAIDAGQMLFVIDACNSGQALESEEQRRGPMNSKGLAQLAYEKGMSILTAAQSYQAALEAAQLGHGYLTFALVEEGLKKAAADRDARDGQILTREWFDYATERVPQMQEGENQARELAKVKLVPFVSGEEKSADVTKRSIQRPRVFYRRELESNPFIVAKP
jgi:WD40 repeat protein/uncharacterized caspase-like protein